MRTILSGLPLLLILAAHSQPRKLAAESSISQVIVFSSGARIERSVTVVLPAGKTELTFSGLSNQLDPKTVQLAAEANLTLLSVQSSRDFLRARQLDREEQEFLDRIQGLRDKLAFDQKSLDVCAVEENMLGKNESITGANGVKTADLKEAVDFHRQRLTELFQKELTIRQKMEREKAELDRLTAQLAVFGKKRDSVNYTVTALVDAGEAATVQFLLSYNVADAGWYPSYDVRVQDVSKPLTLAMTAHVFQRSGETWKNVSLRLSTGNPSDNATPADLQPWLLGYPDAMNALRPGRMAAGLSGRITNEQGEPVAGAMVTAGNSATGTLTDGNGFFRLPAWNGPRTVAISAIGYEPAQLRVAPGYLTAALKPARQALDEVVVAGFAIRGASSIMADSDTRNKAPKAIALKPVVVETIERPTTLLYEVKERYTLESDGATTAIGIRAVDVPAIYRYEAAPKIDPSAFLSARIAAWRDLDLQPGEVNLYYEGAYLGKTYLDLDAAGDTLTLALGKDNGVKVVRRLVKEYSAHRFIGSNQTDAREYEIAVRNNKKISVNLVLKDQIPVSTNKEIGIDDVKATEAKPDRDTGILTWNLSLAPGEEKKFSLAYAVKYPRDKRLSLE